MAAMMSRALVFSPLAMGEPREVGRVPDSEDVTESVGVVVTLGGNVSLVSWFCGWCPAEAGSRGRSNSERFGPRDDFTRATYDGG